jgi:hypothetical protein
MRQLLDSDFLKVLGAVIFLIFISSFFIKRGYLTTYKKLQAQYGGRVRNRWVTFPEYVVPQPDGDIVVSAVATSGSRLGMTLTNAWLSKVPAFQFSIVSNKMPNRSPWKIPENWNPGADPDFSSRFKSYAARPEILDLILTSDIRTRMIALDEKQPVRVTMEKGGLYKDGWTDIANQVPRLCVAAYPNTDSLATTEELLALCIALRNRILALGAQLPATPEPTSSIPVEKLFK